MLSIPTPVLLITLAQAIGMLTAPLVVFVGGFIGLSLAPSPSMATLPVAAMVVGTALAGMPAALIMQRIGRRKGFVYSTLIALLGSILAIYSVRNELFWGLCLSILILGMHLAFVYQFRFAGLEWVKADKAAQTTSFMMLGGLFSAWFGPELAMLGMDLLSVRFTGIFMLLAVAHILLLLLIGFIEFIEVKKETGPHAGRSWLELLKSPGIAAAVTCSAVAFGVMSFIMTATPISMSEIQNFPLSDTKIVIQSHIMAMFAPSLVAPFILRFINTFTLLLIGLGAMVVAITVALLDQSFLGYWVALVCLGFGWNFSFVGGTSLLAQSYCAEESYSAQAVNELTVFGTQAIMSLMAGVIVFNYGWNALNLCAIPLLMFALFMLARWHFQLAEKS